MKRVVLWLLILTIGLAEPWLECAWAAGDNAPLTLEQAISQALANAPGLAQAQAQSTLDRAREHQAAAPLFPSIAGVGDYNQAPGYSKTVTNGGQTEGELTLDYLAFDGGRRQSQVRAADYVAQASRLGIDVASAQIVFDTTVAYDNLLHARAVLSALQNSSRQLNRYIVIVEDLRNSGRMITNDVLKIRAVRDGNELLVGSAQQAVTEAAIVLDTLIGLPEGTDIVLAGINGLPSLPSGDVALSPVFRAAQRQLDAAVAQVNAARAERMPTLKVGLTSGWLGINPQHTFDHNLGASYDTALNVPIFEGGLIRAHIDEAQAARQVALAQLRAVQLSARRDLADAAARYRGARRQLALLATAQTTATDAFALTWTRFLGGGTATVLEVTDAYQQAENLRIARLDSELAAEQAAAQAALVLGIAS